LLGLIQEQHPDRYRLFAQWKQMDFPVLHDPMTKTGIKVVPVFVAIDEYGIVRSTRPNLQKLEDEFINQSFDKPEVPAPILEKANVTPQHRKSELQASESVEAFINLGDAILLCNRNPDFAEVINHYQSAAKIDPKRADILFRLGVTYRMRYDSENRQQHDFANASEYWTQALALDPNHYIWRRRIEQYGPRMNKPYPFYSWIEQARQEITKRGEKPTELAVEPKGAELASPAREFEISPEHTNPDPDAKIFLDTEKLIEPSIAVVPANAAAGSTVRVHVSLRPNDTAKWNNEAGKTQLWINASDQYKLSDQLIEFEQPQTAESHEARGVEFEVAMPEGANESVTVTGFVLYYVCEDTNGQCLFRRQDLKFQIPIVPANRRRGR
jgi:tetratricopeptide (TPR) repeat protein